jgi:hypothetical protein
MLVGLLQHQYSYIEALATHPGPLCGVVWCVNNDVAADVAYLDRSAKLIVAWSISSGP